MQKEFGPIRAKKLEERIDQLRFANNLEALRFDAGHFHELTGDKKGQIACSLDGRNRLIFEPANEPLPTKPDGGIDWKNVTAVRIIEIVDYHE